MDQVKEAKLNGNIVSLATDYTYDEIGDLKTVTVPNGDVTIDQYDSLERLQTETIKDSAGNVIASYGYHVRPDGF